MLLRDILDLDATYGGGLEQAGAAASSDGEAANGANGADDPTSGIEGELSAEEPEAEIEENQISLAAMEAQLKPAVLATFDTIAELHKKLHRVQEQRLAALQRGESPARPVERRYERLKGAIIDAVRRVRLNNTRVEELVHQH